MVETNNRYYFLYRRRITTKASSYSIYRRTTESVGGLFWNREIPGHSDTRGSCGRTQHRRGQNSGKMVDWFVLTIWNSSSIILYCKKDKKKIDWFSLNLKLFCRKNFESDNWIDARPHTTSRSFIYSWCLFRNSIRVHSFWRVAFRWKAFFIIESFIQRLWREAQS